MNSVLYIVLTLSFFIGGCETDDNNNSSPNTNIVTESDEAKVVSVNITGEATNYTFNVGVQSPDTGCDQYADWWEIVTEEGELIHRRILAHSHVSEQPFVRSGSAINITENQILIIRAHMNNTGYGTQVFKGSVSAGFNEERVAATFANNLATSDPLPNNCAF